MKWVVDATHRSSFPKEVTDEEATRLLGTGRYILTVNPYERMKEGDDDVYMIRFQGEQTLVRVEYDVLPRRNIRLKSVITDERRSILPEMSIPEKRELERDILEDHPE